MRQSQFFVAALMGLASASPARRHIAKREVPQEHSHELYLSITREFLLAGENPLGIVDPVFGLLGNAAAAEGVEADIDLDCLKQFTADQAFTNAKALGDVRGMAGALVFQAIERNTGSVGLKSVICPEDAVNPEIAAFDQHQDPASEDAAATNKAITLELAKQLALIGVDPLLALESGTFAPGEIGDPTGAGNSCDDLDDPIGCIFTQDLLVLDTTPDEVLAAVDGVTPTFTGTGVIEATNINFEGIQVADGGVIDEAPTATETEEVAIETETLPAGFSSITGTDGKCTIFVPKTTTETTATPTAGSTVTGDDGDCTIFIKKTSTSSSATPTCSLVTTTVPAAQAATLTGTIEIDEAEETATPASNDIQAFTGTLGVAALPVISGTGDRPFSVNGATFNNAAAALARSCDVQKNGCANAANSGALTGSSVTDCEAQADECRAANALKKRQDSTFGSCTDPTIVFDVGFDGRTEASFAPSNKADFNQGSAQRIGIVANFICNQLQSSCQASDETVELCQEAATAAGATTQDQTAADAFNTILTGDAPVVEEDDEDEAAEETVIMVVEVCQ